MMVEFSIARGISSACIYYHKVTQRACLVRGYGFVCDDAAEQLQWFRDQLNSKLQIKSDMT